MQANWDCRYYLLLQFDPAIAPSIAERMKTLILQKQQAYGFKVLAMDIEDKHACLIIANAPNQTLTKLAGRLKGFLSHQLRKENPGLRQFTWEKQLILSTDAAALNDKIAGFILNP